MRSPDGVYIVFPEKFKVLFHKFHAFDETVGSHGMSVYALELYGNAVDFEYGVLYSDFSYSDLFLYKFSRARYNDPVKVRRSSRPERSVFDGKSNIFAAPIAYKRFAAIQLRLRALIATKSYETVGQVGIGGYFIVDEMSLRAG